MLINLLNYSELIIEGIGSDSGTETGSGTGSGNGSGTIGTTLPSTTESVIGISIIGFPIGDSVYILRRSCRCRSRQIKYSSISL